MSNIEQHAQSDGNSYSEEIFTLISDKDCDKIILLFCESLFQNSVYDVIEENNDIIHNYIRELIQLLKQIPRPYTIVQEFYHIDSSYRDAYYNYFSNQHFQVKRYSRRLSFFAGAFDENDFFSTDLKLQQRIAGCFIGSCVINPLATGIIGRTLINPKYLLTPASLPVYLRLSKFELNIYGQKFNVYAFPYRMQDEVTMRCAEVTILNLLDYYANSYNDYRNVVPSEILENEKKHNHERVLPSRGISYPILTKVLLEFGFSPRLYNLSSIDNYSLSQVT